MFEIAKNEPDFFKEAKQKVILPLVSTAWSDDNIKNIRYDLRAYILLEEQSLLCAYCEKEIDEHPKNSNIDHYKTRNLSSIDTLNYNNLLVSCNSKQHCSHIKDNFGHTLSDYINVINPVIDNPNDFFEYGLSGDILIKDGLSILQKNRAEFTIEIFKLDDVSLVRDRRRIVDMMQLYKNQDFELNSIFNFLTDYKSFIECTYQKLKKEEN